MSRAKRYGSSTDIFTIAVPFGGALTLIELRNGYDKLCEVFCDPWHKAIDTGDIARYEAFSSCRFILDKLITDSEAHKNKTVIYDIAMAYLQGASRHYDTALHSAIFDAVIEALKKIAEQE